MQHKEISKCFSWAEAAARSGATGEAFALVTIFDLKGSAPRNVGAKLFVSASMTVDSIGGGHLEHLAIKKAREMLAKNKNQQIMQEFPLGEKLGQCCGGRITLLFEAFEGVKKHLALFGAGHVGQALVKILAELPVKITWVDSREDIFPLDIPPNINRIVTEEPEAEIVAFQPGTCILAMTHKHPIDFEIVLSALRWGQYDYLGVIGSKTKAKRFQMRLKHLGFDENTINSMRCPVGLGLVSGKQPMEIAVSIAGELISLYQEEKQQNEYIQTDEQITDVKRKKQLQGI